MRFLSAIHGPRNEVPPATQEVYSHLGTLQLWEGLFTTHRFCQACYLRRHSTKRHRASHSENKCYPHDVQSLKEPTLIPALARLCHISWSVLQHSSALRIDAETHPDFTLKVSRNLLGMKSPHPSRAVYEMKKRMVQDQRLEHAVAHTRMVTICVTCRELVPHEAPPSISDDFMSCALPPHIPAQSRFRGIAEQSRVKCRHFIVTTASQHAQPSSEINKCGTGILGSQLSLHPRMPLTVVA